MNKIIMLFGILTGVLLAGTTGKIAGRVTDSNTGAPLVGCNIILEGTNLGVATDMEGYYIIIGVNPGEYSLLTSMIGYANQKIIDVIVMADMTTKINILLTMEVLEGQVITVEAKRPMIQKDATASAAIITSKDLELSPVETVNSIIMTKAGVTSDAAGVLHFRGGRENEILYIIDGIESINPYTSGQGIEIATNAIQEISVLTGSFNAEYGKALSGIVNLVTKEGQHNFGANFSLQAGGLITDYSIDQDPLIREKGSAFNPSNTKEIELSLHGSVPFTNKATYYLSLRNYDDGGYLYAFDRNSTTWGLKDSIGNIVPVNWKKKLNGQGKIAFYPFQSVKLTYSAFFSKYDRQKYSHRRKYIIDGNPIYHDKGTQQILKISHQITGKTMYSIAGSIHESTYNSGAYNNPFDPRQVPGDYYRRDDSGEFYIGGTENDYVEKNYNSKSVKFTFLSQINRHHELKLGFDFQKYKMKQYSYSLYIDQRSEPFIDMSNGVYNAGEEFTDIGNGIWDDGEEFIDTNENGTWDEGEEFTDVGNGTWDEGEPFVDEGNGIWDEGEEFTDVNRNGFWDDETTNDSNGDGIPGNITKAGGLNVSESAPKPVEASAFIQDKIELNDMVLNIGIRWDYFDPNHYIANDWNNPSLDNTSPVKPKWQISPRLSLAFATSDAGKLFFSYGHFFQRVPFEKLYHNPEFDILPGLIKSDVGNADLLPEQTTSYEIGYEHAVTPDIAIKSKLFFKDIRNLLGQRIYILPGGSDSYALYINRDFGEVKGVNLSIEKRFTSGFGGSIDYSYQVAKGNESDPTQTRRDYRLHIEEEKKVVHLHWDQTHTLRINAMINLPEKIQASFITRIESGYPYTPAAENEIMSIAGENSGKKPLIFKTDLNVSKRMQLITSWKKINLSVYAKVYNLFDRKNENYVWDSTGRAGYSLGRYGGAISRAYESRPHWYSKPRTIYLGCSMEL